MRLLKILIIIYLIVHIVSQSTYKENKILSRKKRFLTFPEGSNLVMTISSLKEILLKIPKGFRTVMECDVQFKLPNKSFRSYVKDLSMHTRRHRREIFDEITKVFYMFDLNGEACIKKMVCEAQVLQKFQENSLFLQLLYTVFMEPLTNNTTEINCNSIYDCDISLLGIILNHIYN